MGNSEYNKFRESYIDFLVSQNFNFCLTLNWNPGEDRGAICQRYDFDSHRCVSLKSAREQVGNLFFRVERKLFGRRFNEMSIDRRVHGVFFFEHISSNIHCHGLLRVPPGYHLKFRSFFPEDRGGLWSKVRKSGSYCLKEDFSPRCAAAYCSKDVHKNSNFENSLWLDEFHSK